MVSALRHQIKSILVQWIPIWVYAMSYQSNIPNTCLSVFQFHLWENILLGAYAGRTIRLEYMGKRVREGEDIVNPGIIPVSLSEEDNGIVLCKFDIPTGTSTKGIAP